MWLSINPGAIVATQNLVRSLALGLFFIEMSDLRAQLDDSERLEAIRSSVWQHRERFTFDFHVPGLVEYFHQVIHAQRLKPINVSRVATLTSSGRDAVETPAPTP